MLPYRPVIWYRLHLSPLGARNNHSTSRRAPRTLGSWYHETNNTVAGACAPTRNTQPTSPKRHIYDKKIPHHVPRLPFPSTSIGKKPCVVQNRCKYLAYDQPFAKTKTTFPSPFPCDKPPRHSKQNTSPLRLLPNPSTPTVWSSLGGSWSTKPVFSLASWLSVSPSISPFHRPVTWSFFAHSMSSLPASPPLLARVPSLSKNVAFYIQTIYKQIIMSQNHDSFEFESTQEKKQPAQNMARGCSWFSSPTKGKYRFTVPFPTHVQPRQLSREWPAQPHRARECCVCGWRIGKRGKVLRTSFQPRCVSGQDDTFLGRSPDDVRSRLGTQQTLPPKKNCCCVNGRGSLCVSGGGRTCSWPTQSTVRLRVPPASLPPPKYIVLCAAARMVIPAKALQLEADGIPCRYGKTRNLKKKQHHAKNRCVWALAGTGSLS